MNHTQSATKLTPVAIEPNGSVGADVWLNRNIQAVDVELADGLSQKMWEAEQVHYVSPDVPDANTILENFDEVWDAHDQATDIPIPVIVGAIAELSDMVASIVGGE